MEKFNYNEKMKKFIGSVITFLLVIFVAYAGYLYYLFMTMPSIKTKVAGLYQLFSGGYAPANIENTSIFKGHKPEKNTKDTGTWTTINTKTSDETIERLSSLSQKEVMEKIDEAKKYEKLLDSNSLKLLKAISRVLSKNNGSVVISGEDEKQLKEMLDRVLDDYKHNRIPGIEEIEKETGKW